MENNQEFELQTPVGHLFQQSFRSADEGEKCETLLAVDIWGRIQKKNKFKTVCNQIRNAMNRTETYNSTTQ